MSELRTGQRVKLSVNSDYGIISVGGIYLGKTGSQHPTAVYYLDREIVVGQCRSWAAGTSTLSPAIKTLLKALGLSMLEPRCWSHDRYTALYPIVSKYGNECPCGIHPNDCRYHQP